MSQFKDRLRVIVEGDSTLKGRAFDYVIEALIILSMVSFALETLPDLSAETYRALRIIEIICVLVFTLEYALRIYVAKNRRKYIFSFYGIIDLLAILPFYITASVDLRMLRVFRIFRVFHSLKLLRYSRALKRFHMAASIIKEEIVLFLIATSIMVFFSASGIYFFENEVQPELFKSVFHSLWWAIVTLTTVGYGDVYPITVGGKVFTFFVLILGVAVITVPAGLVASALTKARIIEQKKREKKRKKKSRPTEVKVVK